MFSHQHLMDLRTKMACLGATHVEIMQKMPTREGNYCIDVDEFMKEHGFERLSLQMAKQIHREAVEFHGKSAAQVYMDRSGTGATRSLKLYIHYVPGQVTRNGDFVFFAGVGHHLPPKFLKENPIQ